MMKNYSFPMQNSGKISDWVQNQNFHHFSPISLVLVRSSHDVIPLITVIVKCLEVKCDVPTNQVNAKLVYLSGNSNVSFGAMVEYQCLPGFWISKERGPRGDWITNMDVLSGYIRNGAIATCSDSGKWNPLPINIRCTGIIDDIILSVPDIINILRFVKK